jgi:uncharacterized OB-fold protein
MRPRPGLHRDSRFFWEGVRRGELLIQRCTGCGRLRHPPSPMCPACRSLASDAVKASGRGAVYSFCKPHEPRLPGFDPGHVVVLVELAEGTRLVSNLVGIDPAAVYIGLPVEVEFVAVDPDLTLPMFRPVRG